MRIDTSVAELLGRATEIRRELHRCPETGFEEHKTQQYILSFLEGCKPDKLEIIAGTGVKAVWFKSDAEKTVAFRADMDGLNFTEKNETDYISGTPGKMHACGHDGHMTMLLLLCGLVSANREKLNVNVVALFQPGEEGYGGAERMIDGGALENPRVDVIYGIHLWPDVPKGKLGVRWGPMMASSCEFDCIICGVSAHGASPQYGIDAVVAAAEFISTVQTAITRSLDPHENALLTIGKITGGTARNIIADRVVLNGTLRVFSPEVYDKLLERIHDICKGLSRAFGAGFEIKELMKYPVLNNPRSLVEDFYKYVDMNDVVLVEPSLAAEDFACYQQHIPGLFFFVGIGGGKNTAPLHSSVFDFDEDALLVGVNVYAKLLGFV